MDDRSTRFLGTLRAARDRRRRRRRTAIVLFTLIIANGYLAARIGEWFQGPAPRPEPLEAPLPPATSCRDVLCAVSWPHLERSADGGYEQWVANHRIVYTLDPELQEQAVAVFERYKVPYGAFVALEPATGKILALAEYSAAEPDLTDFCRRSTYPAASLIKLVTASAALETGKVTPDTEFRYEGSRYRLYPRKIAPNNRWRENNVTTVAHALGKSNNVVFAKLGADIVGPERLLAELEGFGFNRELPFDFRLQESRATVPEERFSLARTAAGFGEVYLSPVHAALIAATIGNGGVMMQPYVVASMEGPDGKEEYRAAPAPLERAVPEAIARQVAKMMVQTVTAGTSAKVFRRYARKLRRQIGVAGKTGSLTGHDPPGNYEWFVGFAPVDDPQIAVASLVVNSGDLWHIKGTYVAQSVMKEFFGM